MKLRSNNELEFKQEFIFIKEITKILDSKTNVLSNFTSTGSGWFKIKNEKITNIILETLSDSIKKKIMELLMKKALTVPEIIKKLRMPSTSVYRKCNEMIQDGIVITSGYYLSSDGKRTYAYHSIISDIKINFDGKILVFVKIRN